MIIITNANGDLVKTIDADNVHQGSNVANHIVLLAPFPSSAEVTIAYRLPYGELTKEKLMTPYQDVGQGFNGWSIDLDEPITAKYGQVDFQFKVYTGSSKPITNVYTVGQTPYANDWLSLTDGGQPLVPDTNSIYQVVDGQYQGQQFYWNGESYVETYVDQVPTTVLCSFPVLKGVEKILPPTPSPTIYQQILNAIAQVKANIVSAELESKAILPYSSTFSYSIQALTYFNDRLYKSLIDNNIGNPVSDTTKWQEVRPSGDWGNIYGNIQDQSDLINYIAGVEGRLQTNIEEVDNRLQTNIEETNELRTSLQNKQDKTDQLLNTTSKTIVGGINELKATDGEHTRQISENSTQIAINTSDIETLKQSIVSGETYIGTLTGNTLPTSEQLNQFVLDNTSPSRPSRQGDVIIFVLENENANKNYKYQFGTNGWQGYEISSFELSKNGTAGLVQGTYAIGDTNDTLVNIAGGKVLNIYVKDTTGVYRDIKEYANSINTTIQGIIDGTIAINATALKALQDGLGNNIAATYATKTELNNGLYDYIGREQQVDFNATLENDQIVATLDDSIADFTFTSGTGYLIHIYLPLVTVTGDLDNSYPILLKDKNGNTININSIFETRLGENSIVGDLCQIQNYDVGVGYSWLFYGHYKEVNNSGAIIRSIYTADVSRDTNPSMTGEDFHNGIINTKLKVGTTVKVTSDYSVNGYNYYQGHSYLVTGQFVDGDLILDTLDLTQQIFTKKEVIISAPTEATQGTIEQEQLDILQDDDSNYIFLNGQIYTLANNRSGYLAYTHTSQDNTEDFVVKCLTITISTLAWTLTEITIANKDNTAQVDANNLSDENVASWNTKLGHDTIDFTSQVSFNTAYARAQFLKSGNTITIMFQGESKTYTENDVIFTIPQEYRPKSANNQFWSMGNIDLKVCNCDINISTGQLLIPQITGDTATGRLYFAVAYNID